MTKGEWNDPAMSDEEVDDAILLLQSMLGSIMHKLIELDRELMEIKFRTRHGKAKAKATAG